MERGEPTRCEDCNAPELWPENAEAGAVYLAASTQWRVGPAGITGMDYTAVNAIMQARGVNKPDACLDKIRTLERETLKIHHEKRERGDAN